MPEYLHKHRDVLLSTAELPTFYIAKVRFSWFLIHPFWYKSHFFTKEKMNSKICHDTLVGIPEYLHKHQDVLLSTAELPTFNIAKVRFSRFLSHPFWHKSLSFHKRKDEFENLSPYTCWHTKVPSQTSGRVALHRRTSYILHCKDAFFMIFEPSLLIQKTFFFTKEKMNSNIYHDTLVGIPEFLHKHQDVLLSIAELPTYYIANVRFSWFLSHPFWYQSHFFTKEEMNSKICHDTLAGIPEYLQRHQDVLLSIAELPTIYIANVRFSRFLSHPFWHKVIFFTKE